MEYSFISDPVLRAKLEKASKLSIGKTENINEKKLSKNEFSLYLIWLLEL